MLESRLSLQLQQLRHRTLLPGLLNWLMEIMRCTRLTLPSSRTYLQHAARKHDQHQQSNRHTAEATVNQQHTSA